MNLAAFGYQRKPASIKSPSRRLGAAIRLGPFSQTAGEAALLPAGSLPACNSVFSRQDSRSSELVLLLLHHARIHRDTENAIKRDEIAGRPRSAFSDFRRPLDRTLRLADVKGWVPAT